jgi:large subunit ribosomal protein L13
MRQTTIITQPEKQLTKAWHIVDADGQRLGRMATEVAMVLMGKHRPTYTAHVDTGDFVIIVNAEKVVMTGNKAAQRTRTFYSGYAGGLRTATYQQLLDRKPEAVVEDAIRRMLPKGRLGRAMIGKLKVFKGAEHPHAAQQPVAMKIA